MSIMGTSESANRLLSLLKAEANAARKLGAVVAFGDET
jgi:hypothetical protein